jgi:hypothetical protein
MAYSSITTQQIAIGEPITNELMTKVKDNFDNHEARLTVAEVGSSTYYDPITFHIYGRPSQLTLPYSDYMRTTVNFNITITGVFLLIDIAGSSGATEIDIKHNTSGSFTSVFSTKPSVAFGAGNNAISTNGVLNPSFVNVDSGKVIQLDVTLAQVDCRNAIIRLDYIKR